MKTALDCVWVNQMARALVCEIAQEMSGIELSDCVSLPEHVRLDELDAVYSLAVGNYRMQMQFRAQDSMFFRLAKNMIGDEPEDQFEVQEYAVEFFNVLCGRFVSELSEANQRMACIAPPQYETSPNVTELVIEPLHTLCFMSEDRETAVFSWTALQTECCTGGM